MLKFEFWIEGKNVKSIWYFFVWVFFFGIWVVLVFKDLFYSYLLNVCIINIFLKIVFKLWKYVLFIVVKKSNWNSLFLSISGLSLDFYMVVRFNLLKEF